MPERVRLRSVAAPVQGRPVLLMAPAPPLLVLGAGAAAQALPPLAGSGADAAPASVSISTLGTISWRCLCLCSARRVHRVIGAPHHGLSLLP